MTLEQESQTDAELDALINQQLEVQNQIDSDVQPDLVVTPDVPVVQQQEMESARARLDAAPPSGLQQQSWMNHFAPHPGMLERNNPA